jgi:uncharacterized peroxidase-related enzyme
MSRIQPNSTPDAKSQELLAGVQKMLGGTPNMFTTLAHSSSSLGFAVAGFTGFGASKLGGALREQLALTVAGANGCEYCASAHTALGKMNKIAETELANNIHAKSSDAKTQAALTFARKLVDARGHVADADVNAVRTAGYSEADIIDIVTIVAFNTFTNYINEVAKTQIDFPLVSLQNVAKAA